MKVPEPRKLPSGAWHIQLRLGGDSISITDPSKTECIHRAELMKAEYRNGKKIEKIPAKDKTLKQILEDYVKRYKTSLSPSTVPGYQSIIDHHFPDYINRKAGEIDYQKMMDAEKKRVSEKTGTTYSAKTLKNAWGLVSAALSDAKVPVPEVKLPQITQATRPWLSREEIKVFLDAIHGKKMEIPALMALLSMRRSELVAVTWENVDLKNEVIHVKGAIVRNENKEFVYKKENKTSTSNRTVPIMIPELLEALKAVPEAERKGRVVTCHPNSIYKAVNSVCEKNGLPLVGVHGLRHSFASLGHAAGVPEHEMQLMGGWKDAGTMHRIYEHIEAAEILRHQNAMADFYKNRNAPPPKSETATASE